MAKLTNAVCELTMQNANSEGGRKGGRPKTQPKYTSDGQPICLRCEGVGHMSRRCTAPRKPGGSQSPATPSPAVQGNRVPPLL